MELKNFQIFDLPLIAPLDHHIAISVSQVVQVFVFRSATYFKKLLISGEGIHITFKNDSDGSGWSLFRPFTFRI